MNLLLLKLHVKSVILNCPKCPLDFLKALFVFVNEISQTPHAMLENTLKMASYLILLRGGEKTDQQFKVFRKKHLKILSLQIL